MATIENIILTDSLDPRIQNGVETVTFFHPVTGAKLEVELGEANRKHFANHLAKLEKYTEAAREVTEKPARKAVGSKSDLTAVREWAKANGYQVGDRGRIKAEILEAFDKAQMPTAVAADKVVLTVSPEAQEKLEEIAEQIEAAKVLGTEIDEVDSREHEADKRAENDAFRAMLTQAMDENGQITPESAEAAGLR